MPGDQRKALALEFDASVMEDALKTAIALGVALLACVDAHAYESVSVDVPVQGRENVSYAYADVLRADPIYEEIPADGAACGAPAGSNATMTIHGDGPKPEVSDGDAMDDADSGVDSDPDDGVDEDADAASYEDSPEALLTRASVGKGVPILLADASGGVPSAVCATRAVQRRIAAYNVEYRYKGALFMSRMDYDPGNKLRIRITVAPAD